MENATKFLLIAGAVLIVMVLISAALVIVNLGQEGIDSSIGQMTAFQKQAFNMQFTDLQGKQKGTSVRALLTNVITSNNEYYEVVGKQIAVEFDTEKLKERYEFLPNDEEKADEFAKAIRKAMTSSINTGSTYDVEVNTKVSTGLVSEIIIRDYNASSSPSAAN